MDGRNMTWEEYEKLETKEEREKWYAALSDYDKFRAKYTYDYNLEVDVLPWEEYKKKKTYEEQMEGYMYLSDYDKFRARCSFSPVPIRHLNGEANNCKYCANLIDSEHVKCPAFPDGVPRYHQAAIEVKKTTQCPNGYSFVRKSEK